MVRHNETNDPAASRTQPATATKHTETQQMIPTLCTITIATLLAGTTTQAQQADHKHQPAHTIRVATFNIKELSRTKLDQTDTTGQGTCPQLRNAAEVIQRVRPDILLINEIDFDPETRQNANLFRDRYLKISQHGQQPITYDHIYFQPVNTGLPSGKDFSNNGKTGDPDDAFGFGRYPGQYGMALYSRFPIDTKNARTFQKLLWKQMPGHLIPDGQQGRPAWYSPDEVDIFRLSSKSHWDLPVQIGSTTIHLLCSHPTPPVFDGPEDRNGRRNFDEIRLWADYISATNKADYITDDNNKRGGLPPTAHFIILGDLNADPVKGATFDGHSAIDQLLNHPRVRDPHPTSKGAIEGRQPGPPQHNERLTAHFGRADYVLPSDNLAVKNTGVFWPTKEEEGYNLTQGNEASSDHHLVWIDIALENQ